MEASHFLVVATIDIFIQVERPHCLLKKMSIPLTFKNFYLVTIYMNSTFSYPMFMAILPTWFISAV